MVQKNVAFAAAAAAVAVGFSSVTAAPLSNDDAAALVARNPSKFREFAVNRGKDVLQTLGTNRLETAAKNLVKVQPPTQPNPVLDRTVNGANVPFSKHAVGAATSNTRKPASRRKRELLEELFEREFEDDLFGRDFEEELYARATNKFGQFVGNRMKDGAQTYLTSKADAAAKDQLKSQTPPNPAVRQPIQNANLPFNPNAVGAATSSTKKPASRKKRDLLELYERDIADIADFLEARWLELEDLD